MSDKTELLPCPFCGGNAQINNDADDRCNRVIECADCGSNIGANHYAEGVSRWNRRATIQPTAVAPIKMILHCPQCHTQHIDAPDKRTEGWTNPPHRSHLCHHCNHIWRPADVATEGVAAIETRGEHDHPANAAEADAVRDAALIAIETKMGERTRAALAAKAEQSNSAGSTPGGYGQEDLHMIIDANRARMHQVRGPDRRFEPAPVAVEHRLGGERRALAAGDHNG